MTARRLRLAGFEFRLTDIVTLGGLVLFTVLAIAFNGRLAHPATLIASTSSSSPSIWLRSPSCPASAGRGPDSCCGPPSSS